MKALLTKELKSFFCSSTGAFFSIAFLLIAGLVLWVFGGSYNIPDSGYAELRRFFDLTPILFAVLIPALTMRLIAEEKRTKTLDILRSRPVSATSICLSKYIATLIFVVTVIATTLIYVYSIYQLANPTGNIDLSSIVASYISLILFAAVFIAIGLFASSLTKNQIGALIIGIVINLFVYFGFELLAGIFLSGKTQIMLSSLGLVNHAKQMQRGVISINDLLIIANYILLFCILTIYTLNPKKAYIIRTIGIILAMNIIFIFIPNLQFDFTADKRYTLSDYSKTLLAKSAEKKENLSVIIWLSGDLNAGFQHLKNATGELLDNLNRYADNTINVKYRNPSLYYKSQQHMYEGMAAKGMNGIMLNEIDREGKASQKLIYPYAEISNGSDTLAIPLLKNVRGYTAEENLNASVENLEFEFVDAIRLLNQEKPKSIAFIEGNGELPRAYLYDAEERLSKYYFVNRGEIGHEVGVLNNFDAVIIAGPTRKYSEQEKYILDQYIMAGGKVLWLIDGAYYSHDMLVNEGHSPSMRNEVNLDDILFTYGVRINADLIQDKQCSSIPLVSGNNSQTTLMPCFFIPQLMPSPQNEITKDIKDVKTSFASSLDIVNSNNEVSKNILLTTSANTHLIKVPETIDFDIEQVQSENNYFEQQYIPVAISLEGSFPSAFANRMIPDSLDTKDYRRLDTSKPTRMVIISSSDIIRNDIEGQGQQSQVLPMGFDRASGQIFGNGEFIVNAVNWLTDDEGWMQLRTKQQRIFALNKQAVYDKRDIYAILNTALPILAILAIMGCCVLYRKMKYEK